MDLILYSIYALFVVSVVIALIKRSQRTVKFCSFTLSSCVAAQFMKLVTEATFLATETAFGASPEMLDKHGDLIFAIGLESSAVVGGIVTLGYMVIFSIWYLRRYRGLGNIIKFNAVVFGVSALLERLFVRLFALFPTTNLYGFAKIGILLAVMLLLKLPLDLIAEKFGWTDEEYYSSYSSRVKEGFSAIGKWLSKVRAYAVIPIVLGGGIFYQAFTRLFTYIAVVRSTDYTYVDVKMAQAYADDIKTYSIIGAVIAVTLLFVWYVGRLNFAFANKENQLLFHVCLVGVMIVFAVLVYALLWLIPPALTRERLSLQCALQGLFCLPVLCFVMHRLFTALIEKIKYKVG